MNTKKIKTRTKAERKKNTTIESKKTETKWKDETNKKKK